MCLGVWYLRTGILVRWAPYWIHHWLGTFPQLWHSKLESKQSMVEGAEEGFQERWSNWHTWNFDIQIKNYAEGKPGVSWVPKWWLDCLYPGRASLKSVIERVSWGYRETSGWTILGEVGDLAPAMGVHIYTSLRFKVPSLDTRKALPLYMKHDMK